MSGLIVASMSIAVITDLTKKMLGKDDEDKDEKEKMAGYFMESVAGNFLGGSELASFLTGNWYSLQAPSLDVVNDFVDGATALGKGVVKAIDEKDSIYLYKPANEMGKTISTMFGIPLSNAQKYIGAFVRKAYPDLMQQHDMYYNYSDNQKYFKGAVKDGKNLTSPKSVGISASDYTKAYKAQKGITKGVKGNDGKTITNSKSVLQRKAIDEATSNLTQKQRETLYENFGVGKEVIKMKDTKLNSEYNKLKGFTTKLK